MRPVRTSIAIALALAFSGVAIAQTGTDVQRNVNQQERIEQGLQSGQLNTKEAAKLEQGQSHVDKVESNALKDGTVTPAEQAHIDKAQNAQSAAIYNQKHDAQTGNPNSASSKRMQADVQRNANQQARIKQGVTSGAATPQETAKLEHGQANVNHNEAVAGANGHVGAAEQHNIQASENRQSKHIYNKKHNVNTASGGA